MITKNQTTPDIIIPYDFYEKELSLCIEEITLKIPKNIPVQRIDYIDEKGREKEADFSVSGELISVKISLPLCKPAYLILK